MNGTTELEDKHRIRISVNQMMEVLCYNYSHSKHEATGVGTSGWTNQNY